MKELKIALTPAQYEMLIEYLFVGNLVIDGQEINEQRIQNYATMLTEILDKAEEFGKKQLVFSTPQIPNMKFLSKQKETCLFVFNNKNLR